MTQGSRHGSAATIMTEDAKTEKYTAGSPCGAYIKMLWKKHRYDQHYKPGEQHKAGNTFGGALQRIVFYTS